MLLHTKNERERERERERKERKLTLIENDPPPLNSVTELHPETERSLHDRLCVPKGHTQPPPPGASPWQRNAAANGVLNIVLYDMTLFFHTV